LTVRVYYFIFYLYILDRPAEKSRISGGSSTSVINPMIKISEAKKVE